MTTVIEKFVAEVVWDIDPEGLEEFNKQADGVLKMGKAIAGVVASAIGALTGLSAVVNENTSRNMQLAKSVGIAAESLEAYEGIFKRIGFEADNVVDLVEEMNNKLGELAGLGEMTSATDALKLLKIEFKEIRDLAPEDQFETILAAAKDLEDQQVAVSAVDMLMGGEANKIVGYLRTYDDSLEDLLQRQKDLNLLTEEGREGAERWAFVWGDMRTLVGSLIASFSGLLGDALAPLVEESIQWVIQNKELIKIKVRDWVEQVRRAIEFLVSVGKGIIGVTDAVGGLTNALKLLGITIAALQLYKFGGALQAVIVGLNGASVATAAFKAALMGLKTAGIVGLFVLAALALEDLYVALTGGESAFAPLHDAIGKFLAEDVAAFIAGLLGMDPDELNLTIVEFFTQTIPNAYNWMVADFEAAITNFVNFFTTIWAALSEDFTAAVGYWSEFFGETFGDLVNIAQHVFDGIFGIVAAFSELFKGNFSEALGFADKAAESFGDAVSKTVKGVFNLLSNVGETVALALQSVEKTAVGIFKGIYETAKQWIGGAIDWIWAQLKSIPFFDELVGGGQVRGSASPTIGDTPPPGPGQAPPGPGQAPPPPPPVGPPPEPTPLPSVTVAAAQAAAQANTTNQSSTQEINFAPQLNVTQLPGEDGEAFANRVTDLLAEKAGEAVRNNDKGIVR